MHVPCPSDRWLIDLLRSSLCRDELPRPCVVFCRERWFWCATVEHALVSRTVIRAIERLLKINLPRHPDAALVSG